MSPRAKRDTLHAMSEGAPGALPPAGWYPDGVNGQRYWDGQQWTENRAPLNVIRTSPESVASARRLFFLGLWLWLGGFVLASISNGLNAVGFGSWVLVVLFFLVSASGFVISLVGLILWLTRRSQLNPRP